MAKSSTPAPHKPHALSLHIGLNLVDPKHYGGWSGPLAACEFDARDMLAIAKTRGMTPSVLLTKAATRKAVLAALRRAAAKLVKGDLFFLSYSGHGGQVADVSGDEPDKQDETWCLYDGQLIDDELYFELGRFAAGVRILVLSDSCHSGTVTRARPASPPPGMRSKLMPTDVGRRVYEQHQAFYDGLQAAVAKAAGKAASADPDAVLSTLALQGARIGAIAGKFRAAAILISGCQDNQTSLDGDHNGAFTGRLREVWNNGGFRGSHARFHATITAGMSASQTPNLFLLGDAAAFAVQVPFTV
ncbi:MAG: caspase family protein [Pseudomonadota bacterium]